LLFAVLCGIVWFPVFLRCSFDSYWKIDYSIKDLGVNVADPEAMNIPVTLILSYIFVGIMSLYAINLDVVSLFADSSFTFLAMLNDVISIWKNEYHFAFVQKRTIENNNYLLQDRLQTRVKLWWRDIIRDVHQQCLVHWSLKKKKFGALNHLVIICFFIKDYGSVEYVFSYGLFVIWGMACFFFPLKIKETIKHFERWMKCDWIVIWSCIMVFIQFFKISIKLIL